MRQPLTITLTISVLLGHCTSQQYPDCMDCRLSGETVVFSTLLSTTYVSNQMHKAAQ